MTILMYILIYLVVAWFLTTRLIAPFCGFNDREPTEHERRRRG